MALMFSLNLCLRGSGKSNIYRGSNDVGCLWPDPLSQLLQTRTLKAGVCHSARMVAAHTTTTDGTAQPQPTPGRWESFISRYTECLHRSGPGWGPKGPNPEPQGTTGPWASGSDKQIVYHVTVSMCSELIGPPITSQSILARHHSRALNGAVGQGARRDWAERGSSSALHEPPWELWSLALISTLGSNRTVSTGKERAQLLPAHLVSVELNTWDYKWLMTYRKINILKYLLEKGNIVLHL